MTGVELSLRIHCRFVSSAVLLWKCAEREGFEPSMRFRIHTFQACSFDRSDTSPGLRLMAGRRSGPASSRHTLWLLPLLPSGPGGVHNLTLREDRTGPPSIRPSGQRSLAEVRVQKQVGGSFL